MLAPEILFSLRFRLSESSTKFDIFAKRDEVRIASRHHRIVYTVSNMKHDYVIVSAANLERLEGRVNEKLALGFIPVGGVCFDNDCYIQAMMKEIL